VWASGPQLPLFAPRRDGWLLAGSLVSRPGAGPRSRRGCAKMQRAVWNSNARATGGNTHELSDRRALGGLRLEEVEHGCAAIAVAKLTAEVEPLRLLHFLGVGTSLGVGEGFGARERSVGKGW
jgi:hypothetical protein